jgi:hypothetical protein
VSGVAQFGLVRGPGRGLLTRCGPYLGITPARLETASSKLRRGGVPSISPAILTPDVWSIAVVAAYYVNRASAAWVPKNHDEAVIRHNLEKFYRIARLYSGLKFDPQAVAQLEAEYWDMHRQLVGQSDKSAFIQTMTALHAAIFGLPSIKPASLLSCGCKPTTCWIPSPDKLPPTRPVTGFDVNTCCAAVMVHSIP